MSPSVHIDITQYSYLEIIACSIKIKRTGCFNQMVKITDEIL